MKIVTMVRSLWNRIRESRRRLIRSIAKGHSDANTRTRAQIVLSLVGGKMASEIAGVLQCSVGLVYKVAHRFMKDEEGAFVDRREDNGTRVVDDNIRRVVWTMVAATPREFGHRRSTWSLELMVIMLRKRMSIRLSRATLCRHLRHWGIRLRRPKPFVECPWPAKRRDQRIQRLLYLLRHARDNEVWVFEDEVDIHLNPKIGPQYMLPGKRKKQLTPGVNVKRYIAGAINAFTGQLTWVESTSKDSELFVRLVFQLGKDYPEAKRVHLILDNFSIHKSNFTKMVKSRCDGKVRFHSLPPYCPDENRIERVWCDLHRNVTRNHQCNTIHELMKEVHHWLRQENKRLLKTFSTRDPQERYAAAA
jgi:transposase